MVRPPLQNPAPCLLDTIDINKGRRVYFGDFFIDADDLQPGNDNDDDIDIRPVMKSGWQITSFTFVNSNTFAEIID